MNATVTDKIQAISKLINENLLSIETVKFQAVMSAALWNVYKADEYKNVCQNMLDFCHMKNSYEGIETAADPTLIIMLKDEQQKVVYCVKFHDDNVEILPIG